MFSKVAGYKINPQKSVAFLYTNNQQSEKEIRKVISFTTQYPKIKISGIKFNEKGKRPIHGKL
jgi:hypothetical protein